MIIDKDIVEESVNLYGELLQSVVCMEELAELTQQLSKCVRGIQNMDELISEVADVHICLEMIKEIYGIDENKLQCEIYRKQERQRKRMIEIKNDVKEVENA